MTKPTFDTQAGYWRAPVDREYRYTAQRQPRALPHMIVACGPSHVARNVLAALRFNRRCKLHGAGVGSRQGSVALELTCTDDPGLKGAAAWFGMLDRLHRKPGHGLTINEMRGAYAHTFVPPADPRAGVPRNPIEY